MSAASFESASIRDRLTPQRLAEVLAEVCAQAGVDPAGAQLVKFTNNAVFRLARAPVVVRIAGSAVVRSRAPKVVAVARWLARHDMPTVRLLPGIDQPVPAGHHMATLWILVPAVGPTPTGVHLAAVLRRFHALPPPDFHLPDWRPVGPIRERISAGQVLSNDERAFLLDVCDEVEGGLARVRYVLPRGPIHGDGFLGNLIPGPTGPMICDFDSTSVGPREWDLTPVAVGRLRFSYAVDTHAELAAAYGFDVLRWSGFPVLRRLRELQLVTSVLPVLSGNPGLRQQWQHRFWSFKDADESARWDPYR
jgi:hypothetical protein